MHSTSYPAESTPNSDTTHNLRRLRTAQGLTRAQLAQHARIPVADIKAFERGRKVISPARQSRLANLFGVSVAHLMGASLRREPSDGGSRLAEAV